jgi:transcriptional regulator with XRE-family HTH domain
VEASAIHQAALVGELLARTTKNEAVSQTQFLAALRKLVGQATQGNLAAFARLVGLTKTTLWELATGRFPPPLSVLLRLCLQLSLAKIAARLGVGKRVLRKYCPDQYQALRVSNKRWDSDEMKMYMRQTLQEALDGEEIVSLYAVQEYLGCQRRILYRIAPDLSEAVNARYQKHFPRALIDGHLREALTHTGPLLSLNALAKQNGWDPGFARSLFPELCRRISSQYKAWQMETRQQQREESYQKIREAIGTLHQKGLYPTKGQICRLIGDTFFMMRADRRSVWQVELEILGYK